MAVRVLIDTNVLVYATDPGELERRVRATEILSELNELSIGALSVQCLSEFFAVVTRKFYPPMSTAAAKEQVASLSAAWPVHDLAVGDVFEAMRAVERHQLSYWDALLWAVARTNGIASILTEDFEHGRLVEGVRYVDPFHFSSVDDVISDILQTRR